MKMRIRSANNLKAVALPWGRHGVDQEDVSTPLFGRGVLETGAHSLSFLVTGGGGVGDVVT
jgi:hypothetical protein